MAKSKTPAKRARAALAARLKQPHPPAGAAHTAQQVLRAAETLADGVLRVAPATPATPAVPLSTVTPGARALAERLAPTPPVDFANQPVPTAEWVHVTPQVAAVWLERNTKNRALRQRVVDRYARDMREGRWHRNGETIKLAQDGTVLDGQHRLWSVVESETAVWMLVVRGLAPEVQRTVDTGANRRFSDALALGGHTNTYTLASVARWLHLYDANAFSANGYQAASPTHGEMEAALARHPRAVEAVQAISGEFRAAKRLISQSALSFVYCLALERDPAEARAFVQAVTDGVNLTTTNPAYRLRERLLNARTSTARLEPYAQVALAIKAFNLWRRRQTIEVLTWRRNEAFPRLDD